jgi:hypothetical protein
VVSACAAGSRGDEDRRVVGLAVAVSVLLVGSVEGLAHGFDDLALEAGSDVL